MRYRIIWNFLDLLSIRESFLFVVYVHLFHIFAVEKVVVIAVFHRSNCWKLCHNKVNRIYLK